MSKPTIKLAGFKPAVVTPSKERVSREQIDVESMEVETLKLDLSEARSHKVSKWDRFLDDLKEPGDAVKIKKSDVKSITTLHQVSARFRKVYERNIIAISHPRHPEHFILVVKDGPIVEEDNNEEETD